MLPHKRVNKLYVQNSACSYVFLQTRRSHAPTCIYSKRTRTPMHAITLIEATSIRTQKLFALIACVWECGHHTSGNQDATFAQIRRNFLLYEVASAMYATCEYFSAPAIKLQMKRLSPLSSPAPIFYPPAPRCLIRFSIAHHVGVGAFFASLLSRLIIMRSFNQCGAHGHPKIPKGAWVCTFRGSKKQPALRCIVF